MDEPSAADARAARVASGLRLARATRHGDGVGAFAAAGEMLRAGGDLVDVYDVVASVVHGLAARSGELAPTEEQRAVGIAQRIVSRLQPSVGRPREHAVVLAVPPDEQHTIGVEMVAGGLRSAGYRVRLLRDCPWSHVLDVVTNQPQLAVVGLTDHVGDSPELRNRVREIRERAGDTAVVVGGYRFTRVQPCARCGADAVLTSARDAVTFVRRVTNPRRERDTEVLPAIAESIRRGLID